MLKWAFQYTHTHTHIKIACIGAGKMDQWVKPEDLSMILGIYVEEHN